MTPATQRLFQELAIACQSLEMACAILDGHFPGEHQLRRRAYGAKAQAKVALACARAAQPAFARGERGLENPQGAADGETAS